MRTDAEMHARHGRYLPEVCGRMSAQEQRSARVAERLAQAPIHPALRVIPSSRRQLDVCQTQTNCGDLGEGSELSAN